MLPSPTPRPILQFSPEQIADLQKVLQSRVVQDYYHWISTPEFSRDLGAIINHPHRAWVLYFEFGWLLSLFIFRTSRLSRLSVSNWARILWLNFWTFIVYWVGAAALPFLLFGSPYRRLFLGLWRVVFR